MEDRVNNSNESKQVQMNNNGVQQTTDLNSMFAINNTNFSVSNSNQSIQNQSLMKSVQSVSTVSHQQNINNNSYNDEDLLKSFIGNNYEKITRSPFNLVGFFFTSLYMFYRKMFLYGLLAFLINLVILCLANNYLVTYAFNVIVGLFINKIYLSYVKKKIATIKSKNNLKSVDELKNICSSKGGTSVPRIFLGIAVEIVMAVVVLVFVKLLGIGDIVRQSLHTNNFDIRVIDVSGTLVEDVSVQGYSCFNSKCSISIEDKTGNTTNYILENSKSDFIKVLSNYKDYIKLNIYYAKKGSEITIVDYKIFIRSNNKDISSVSTEDQLRDKIGLYSVGTHTDSFTLTEIGTVGFASQGNQSYAYRNYKFVNEKNTTFEMKYINDNGSLGLVQGNKYTVTFEVTKSNFGYDFVIKSIK